MTIDRIVRDLKTAVDDVEATINDLLAQLRDREEKLDGLREFLTETQNAMRVVEWQRNTAEAERDAAIERGKRSWRLLIKSVNVRHGMVQDAMKLASAWQGRAEAARPRRRATRRRALDIPSRARV